MGVREIDRSLEQWEMGVKGHAVPGGPGAHAPGEGAMVRHPFAGPGMDGGGHGGDVGARPAYHRTVGVGLWRRRPQGIDFRADWGFPPPLRRRNRRS